MPRILHSSRGAFSGFNKIVMMACLCLLLEAGWALQLHEANATVPVVNAYNQQLYLQQLTMIQNRFATDLTKIQTTFAQLNLQLNQTNISSSS
jgi:hypothetical protein